MGTRQKHRRNADANADRCIRIRRHGAAALAHHQFQYAQRTTRFCMARLSWADCANVLSVCLRAAIHTLAMQLVIDDCWSPFHPFPITVDTHRFKWWTRTRTRPRTASRSLSRRRVLWNTRPNRHCLCIHWMPSPTIFGDWARAVCFPSVCARHDLRAMWGHSLVH